MTLIEAIVLLMLPSPIIIISEACQQVLRIVFLLHRFTRISIYPSGGVVLNRSRCDIDIHDDDDELQVFWGNWNSLWALPAKFCFKSMNLTSLWLFNSTGWPWFHDWTHNMHTPVLSHNLSGAPYTSPAQSSLIAITLWFGPLTHMVANHCLRLHWRPLVNGTLLWRQQMNRKIFLFTCSDLTEYVFQNYTRKKTVFLANLICCSCLEYVNTHKSQVGKFFHRVP